MPLKLVKCHLDNRGVQTAAVSPGAADWRWWCEHNSYLAVSASIRVHPGLEACRTAALERFGVETLLVEFPLLPCDRGKAAASFFHHTRRDVQGPQAKH